MIKTLDIFLNHFPDLIQVKEPLDFQNITKLADDEFNLTIVDQSLYLEKESNTKQQAPLLKPKVLIKNPLSTVILSDDISLEMLTRYNNYVLYLEDFVELNTMSFLYLEISKIYGKEIKFGATILSLLKDNIKFSNKTVKVIFCINDTKIKSEKIYKLI